MRLTDAVGHICLYFALCTLFLPASRLLEAASKFYLSMFPDLDLVWKHRKALHNIWVWLIPTIIWGFKPIFTIAFTSHILLDFLTKSGVYPLWPVDGLNLHFILKSGWQTALVGMLALAGSIIYKFYKFIPPV